MRIETYEYDPRLKAGEKTVDKAKITVKEVESVEPEPSELDLLKERIDTLEKELAEFKSVR